MTKAPAPAPAPSAVMPTCPCGRPVLAVVTGTSTVMLVHERGKLPAQVWGCTRSTLKARVKEHYDE